MKKYRVIGLVLLFAAAFGLLAYYLSTNNISVLNPKGEIAQKQRDLIWTSTLLMLIIVLPVFVLTFFIAWKYRASNKKAKYQPELDGNRLIESLWWAIPSAIIFVLAVIAWRSSHELDPFRQLNSQKPPITIQVVALQWKWLFIYPEQSIASVNQVNFPEDTPVNFSITADAPMNSFWIPQLGGQIYAMAGMNTKLHLMASEPGTYRGSSANISGKGFSDMRFEAVARSGDSFENWLRLAKTSKKALDQSEYDRLAQPGRNPAPAHYRLADNNLYDKVLAKYMSPAEAGGRRGH